MKLSEMQKILKKYENKFGDIEIKTRFHGEFGCFGYNIEKEYFSVTEFMKNPNEELPPSPCVNLNLKV